MYRRSNPNSLYSKDSGFCETNLDGGKRSYRTHNTVPTEYPPPSRPHFVHYDTCGGRLERSPDQHYAGYESAYSESDDPRASRETYASTVDSESGMSEDELEHKIPLAAPRRMDTMPSTPADFAELFPSSRQLTIRHDDSTDDGNMNLRLDTLVHIPGSKPQSITLFHLRLHDLKERQSSLRRYCRNSGREVCTSSRKNQQSVIDSRPGFGRSLSNAFAAMRSISDAKTVTASGVKRSDSGYGSLTSRKSVEAEKDSTLPTLPSGRSSSPIPTNTIKLEFSNYSQVEVRRRGTKGSKRYEFEYWGTAYVWRRIIERSPSSVRVLYHLYRGKETRILARIEPRSLSIFQVREEHKKGGWVPPCDMSIDDDQILRDQNETSE